MSPPSAALGSPCSAAGDNGDAVTAIAKWLASTPLWPAISASLPMPSTSSSNGLPPQHLEVPPRTIERPHHSAADPRELERFDKTFKQRRRKLEVVAESTMTKPGALGDPLTTPETIGRQRKKRTRIEANMRAELEKVFLQNPYPTDYSMLAESLRMKKEVVRVWFKNRRRKEKRINPPL